MSKKEETKWTRRRGGYDIDQDDLAHAKVDLYKKVQQAETEAEEVYWLNRVFHSDKVARQLVHDYFSREMKQINLGGINSTYVPLSALDPDAVDKIKELSIEFGVDKKLLFTNLVTKFLEILGKSLSGVNLEDSQKLFCWIVLSADLEEHLLNKNVLPYLKEVQGLMKEIEVAGKNSYADSHMRDKLGWGISRWFRALNHIKSIFKDFYNKASSIQEAASIASYITANVITKKEIPSALFVILLAAKTIVPNLFRKYLVHGSSPQEIAINIINKSPSTIKSILIDLRSGIIDKLLKSNI